MNKNLYIINIKKKSLGKSSTIISNILKGKLKKNYINNKINGDFINIINIKNIFFSGKYKYNKKIFYKHTGYPGKLKKNTLKNLFKINKKKLILKSIKNMIKKNKIRKKITKNFEIYNNIKQINIKKKLKILNI